MADVKASAIKGGTTTSSRNIHTPLRLTKPTSLFTLGRGLTLKKSHVPNAGNGVYVNKGLKFKRAQLITEYFGRVITEDEDLKLQKQSSHRNSYIAPFPAGDKLARGIDGYGIDPKPGTPCGQWINDPRNDVLYNCKFVRTDGSEDLYNYEPPMQRLGTKTRKRIFIVASKEFQVEDDDFELYINYGKAYWDDMSQRTDGK